MIISEKVSIHRIISSSKNYFLANVATCVSVYLLVGHFAFVPFDIPVLLPSILGTALAFFIGFNNNQAYARWWEARKIWGSLVNDSRSWTRQVIYFSQYGKNELPTNTTINQFIHRHIAFLYALKQNLRKSAAVEYKKHLSKNDLNYIESHSNKANALLNLQTKDINEIYLNQIIDGFQFAELNKLIINFCDEMGKSERISNTVFPTTYNYYTRIFVWIFIVSITAVTAQSMGVWSILDGTLIGYVFLTTHKIGQSLLNPFEEIPTGIPLNQITRTIEINLLETLGEKDIPEPIQSVKDEYIM